MIFIIVHDRATCLYLAAPPRIPNGVTADSLNRHYASISTDLSYVEPVLKTTVTRLYCVVTEEIIFNLLISLKIRFRIGCHTSLVSSAWCTYLSQTNFANFQLIDHELVLPNSMEKFAHYTNSENPKPGDSF